MDNILIADKHSLQQVSFVPTRSQANVSVPEASSYTQTPAIVCINVVPVTERTYKCVVGFVSGSDRNSCVVTVMENAVSGSWRNEYTSLPGSEYLNVADIEGDNPLSSQGPSCHPSAGMRDELSFRTEEISLADKMNIKGLR